MVFPGMADPQQLAQAQALGQHVKAEIRVNYKDGTVRILFAPDAPGLEDFVKSLLEQFPSALATQLSSFFGIQGEIVEVGKS